MRTFKIKELVIDENNEEQGINAISIVDNPAIQVPFQYFAQGLLPFWKWTAFPDDEIIETSHPFCVEHAYTSPDRVYHTSEIREWSKLSDRTFIPESNFFATFDDNVGNFNGDQQIYNCRHYLERVSSIDEVPVSKRHMIKMNEENNKVFFKIESEDNYTIKGMILQSNQMIYRNDVGDGTSGYVYMSRETIRKCYNRFKMNRSITFQHRDDITGNAILMKSWLEEDEKNNCTKWYVEYKILQTTVGKKLWNIIKSFGKNGMGFSIEGLFQL